MVTSVAGAKVNSSETQARADPAAAAATPTSSSNGTVRRSRSADAGVLALLGDEVGQAVLQEPGVGGHERVGADLLHRTSSSRARSTSSAICTTSVSTDSKATIPRSRSTNDTSTSTP